MEVKSSGKGEQWTASFLSGMTFSIIRMVLVLSVSTIQTESLSLKHSVSPRKQKQIPLFTFTFPLYLTSQSLFAPFFVKS